MSSSFTIKTYHQILSNNFATTVVGKQARTYSVVDEWYSICHAQLIIDYINVQLI